MQSKLQKVLPRHQEGQPHQSGSERWVAKGFCAAANATCQRQSHIDGTKTLSSGVLWKNTVQDPDISCHMLGVLKNVCDF